MSEFDVKRDRAKTFKATAATHNKIEELIKKSGKGSTEFFEDLVNDLAIHDVVNPHDDSLSPDLKKHFESDIGKIRNATNSILSIFISQMENIVVEKNHWQGVFSKQLGEKQEEITKWKNEHEVLVQKLEESSRVSIELTKDNETMKKEIDVLTKRATDQEQLLAARVETIEHLNKRVINLNETIVSKDEQLKQIEPIKTELMELKSKNDALELEKTRLNEQYKEELKKQEENLKFQCEKEKHKLKMEFDIEKETIRDEVREKTEMAVRTFYLEELKRKEGQMEQLQQRLTTLPKKRPTSQKKELE